MSHASPDIEDLISTVLDCGFAIHNHIGPGLLESAYEIFLAATLEQRGLYVERQTPISLSFAGITIPDVYRLDLLVEKKLIVELKSVVELAPVHSKQLLTYLRVTNQPVGLLLNFGGAMFKGNAKRVINNRSDYVAPTKTKIL